MPRRSSGHVFVSAGEVSGDRIAAPVVAELSARRPGLQFFGAGGDALREAGVEVRHSADDLAVTGISEVAGAAGAAAGLLADTWRELQRRRPRLGILVDYPGANLQLARLLKRLGVPVLYYVAPQRWAWLPRRVGVIAARVDRLAVTLPFEQQWFIDRGVRATFVGHPLLDLFRLAPADEVRAKLDLDRRPVVALLPGSRPNELERHVPLLVKAMAWMPEVQPVIATLAGPHARRCAELAPQWPQLTAQEAFAIADAAVCASGTATLEAALAGVPAVVFYRLSWLSGAMAKQLIKVPYVALPNLLLSDEVMPELLLDAATPAALVTAVRRLLDPTEATRQRRRFRDAVMMLGEPGAARRVADLAETLLGRRRRRARHGSSELERAQKSTDD